jgi:hypothetical protein
MLRSQGSQAESRTLYVESVKGNKMTIIYKRPGVTRHVPPTPQNMRNTF